MDPSTVKFRESDVKKLAEIHNQAASVSDETLLKTFPTQYRELTAAGQTDMNAKGLLRFQLANLLTQAWVNEWMQSYANRLFGGIAMGFADLISGCIELIQHHDTRLDAIERWRFAAIAELAKVAQLSNRILKIEQNPPALIIQKGPQFSTSTTGAVAAELARFRPDALFVGEQPRTLRIRGVDSTGVAVYSDLLTINVSAAPVTGALTVNNIDHVGLYTGGGAVAAAVGTPATDITITPTGVAATTIVWTVYEVRTDMRPDPSSNPLFKISVGS